MKLVLKEFQDDAVVKLVRYIRAAARESQTGDLQSVCLSSPTGSGKTVMLTRAIEIILAGDEEQAPIPDATFLWITDQPELNEQTRKKMVATSSVLTTETIIVLDASFDQEALRAGTLHFLNIQKLAKDKGLVSRGDKRTFSIWEMIRNTIDTRPGKFFVIIDEAHRGMIEKDQAEAATIIQKFIKGSNGEIPPVPVVVGISATPERFNKLIIGTGRSNRPVDIDPAEVRASGLLKESIVLYHPKKEQPTDMTMLREAARSLERFSGHWSDYCAKHEALTVQPLLLVQVEDASSKGQLSETDLEQALRMVRETLGSLPNDAFAHAFQEGTTLKLGSEDLRYIAPSEINEDPDVRVVFFKTSLNTGWDCPRAEVMMSFRTAVDATLIAQLVGRMVRTPLARRITEVEFLNTVALYLPHYDKKGLEQVINRLSKPDAEIMPPVDIEMGDNLIDLHKAEGSEQAFTALAALPSYVVPRKRKASQVRRLMKLARLLTNHDIDDNAPAEAKQVLLNVLYVEHNRVKDSPRFKEIVEERSKIEVDAVNWDVGTAVVRQGQAIKIDIASEDVEDLFEAVGRKLNEGLHKAWWRERVKADPSAKERAKLELFALAIDPDVMRRIEKEAQATVQKWLRTHAPAIAQMDEPSRADYVEVMSLAATPEQTPLIYPDSTQARRADRTWAKHVYVDDDGLFPGQFNKPEREVLEREIGRGDVVAWLRNVDRKPWALCVPYEWHGEDRPMYPDFLVVRTVGSGHVVDLIDPHAIDLADAPEKASGLAKFAAKHANQFGRIELILLDDNKWKVLDLADEMVRAKVRGVSTPNELRKLFDEA